MFLYIINFKSFSKKDTVYIKQYFFFTFVSNDDPLDWKTSNSDVITKRVVDKVQENDIILMHDASESSVNAAFKIIDELEKEGYTFVTVDEILFD